MLVLTRKKGQKLIINDNIEVVILETRGESVKIGIRAPKDVTIYREEIYEEIKTSNVQSAKEININDISSAMNLIPQKPSSGKSYSDKLNQLLEEKQSAAVICIEFLKYE